MDGEIRFRLVRGLPQDAQYLVYKLQQSDPVPGLAPRAHDAFVEPSPDPPEVDQISLRRPGAITIDEDQPAMVSYSLN
jgi:hypothetical protein